MRDSKLRLAALAAVTIAAMAGCGGGSGEARPSISATGSRTATPSVPPPSATRSASPDPSRSGITRPSDAPSTAEPTTREPTTAEPTTREPTTAEPTTRQPTTAEPTTRQPTAQESTTTSPAAAEETGTDGDTSAAWLLLLLAAVVGGVVGVVLAARHRSARRAWAVALVGARGESEELARHLAPALLADGHEGRRGGWAVARPGVVDLEGRLAALARSAPDVADSTVASDLAAAVGDVRRTLDEEGSAAEGQGATALRAAQDAVRRLEERVSALNASSSPPGPA